MLITRRRGAFTSSWKRRKFLIMRRAAQASPKLTLNYCGWRTTQHSTVHVANYAVFNGHINKNVIFVDVVS